MRIYPTADQEALHARRLLKTWTTERFITPDQRLQLEAETTTELRTTNIFLRLVLFFFTALIVAAGALLLGFMFRFRDQDIGGYCLILAVLAYIAAEYTARVAHFYHHGVEEAFAAGSIALLFAGILFSLSHSSLSDADLATASALSLAFALWIWYRFDLFYTFLAALVFAAFLPAAFTSSPASHRVLLAVIYLAGLFLITRLRKAPRFTVTGHALSLAEAALWLALYLTVSLIALDLVTSTHFWHEFGPGATPDISVPRPFYWLTWLLTWLLPPLILARALRQRDRPILIVAIFTTLLTLVTNKPYLGMARHPWDPMLLGILLIATALTLRRWLNRGPAGVRHGFTAARLSTANEQWWNAASTTASITLPHTYSPDLPPAHQPNLSEGGASGGGGATRDF